jgi:hypothetical protein
MAEFKNDLLREAIADAEQVRETAIANAKLQLEETIAPTIKAEITRALSQPETEVEEAHNPQRGARAQDFAEVGEGVEASDEVEDDASDVEIVNEDEVSEETEEISEEAETAESVDEIEITVRGATTTVSGSELNAPHIREEEEDEEDEEDVEDVDDEEAEEDEDLEDLDLEAIIRELQREVDALDDDDDDDDDEEEVPSFDDDDEEEVEEGDEEEEDEEEDDEDEVEEGTEDLDLDAILREIEAELSDEKDTELAQENTKLQGELDEYRKAVELLRGKLNEVNLLNAKLLFTNKLFKGKELSQEQKIHVVETFDLAMTIREVKLLYATLAEATINVPAKKKQTTSSTKVIAEGIASKVVGGTAPAPEVIEEDQFAGFRKRMKQLAGINEIL